MGVGPKDPKLKNLIEGTITLQLHKLQVKNSAKNFSIVAGHYACDQSKLQMIIVILWHTK